MPLFRFLLASDGPPVKRGERRALQGEEFRDFRELKKALALRDGVIHLANGTQVKIDGPLRPWPATVVEQAMGYEEQEEPPDSEGVIRVARRPVKRLALEIRHPNGFVTLHYPLEGPSAVPHDPAKAMHTWHRPEEGESGS